MKATNLQNGMKRDFSPINQPEGSPTLVLNGIRESSDGNMYNYQFEPSNELIQDLGDKIPIGEIYGENGNKYIFSTNNIDSEIGVLSGVGKYTTIVSDTDQDTKLGFSRSNIITGEYRVRNGCEKVIYWRDSLNNDRFLNLDNLDQFKDGDDWDFNLFKFTPDIKIPKLVLQSVNESGGFLPVGTYRFQVEYMDSNLNSIYRSAISQPVPIYDEVQSDLYETIDGAYNIEAFISDVGGVPETNKSITISISNLDTSFEFFRINVIRNITSDGTTQDAHSVGNLFSITGSDFTFTYRGFNPTSGDINLDATELITQKVQYEESRVMEQVQGRLVRANVSEQFRDYSKYQRIVNDINITWTKKQVAASDATQSGNSKSPNTYWFDRTFMGDEVYAPAIVFIFKNGSESPAFPISGRSPSVFDLQELTVVEGTPGLNQIHVNEVTHLGLEIGDTVPRWRVVNTAKADGTLGYYEATTQYPNKLDCEGDSIWGALAGENVRYPKLPDRSLVPVYENVNDETYLNLLGLKFDNITYPDDDIIGHRFVVAKRDRFNSTVVDTGVLASKNTLAARLNDQEYKFDKFSYIENGEEHVSFWSPKSLLKELSSGDYFKVIGDLETRFTRVDSDQFRISTNNGEVEVYADRNDGEFIPIIDSSSDYTNLSYSTEIFISPQSAQQAIGDFDRIVSNGSHSNTINAFTLDNPISKSTSGLNYLMYVSNKRDVRPYENLDALTYYPMHEGILTLDDSQEIYGGDAFISEFRVFNIRDVESDNNFLGGFLGPDGDVKVYSQYLDGVWVESTINYGLVHDGTGCNQRYNEETRIQDYIINQVADLDEEGTEWIVKSNFCRQFYGYNNDYSSLYSTTPYIPIPQIYNYCSKCLNEYRNRIIFSPKSFDEEISDLYRINFVDDYIDIPAHRGEITGIKYKNNQLFVHTTQTTFILQPNPQLISTDQDTAYLNTGDFLSIPSYELNQTDLGYGGMQNILGNTNSEFGYIWIDANRGEVISLGSKLDELNNKGMNQWFSQNLPFKLNSQWREFTGEDYPHKDMITHEDGIGLDIVFDKKFSRFIITKKDYEIKDPTTYNFSVIDKSKMCDRSLTISFSFMFDSWTSFHSYTPTLFLSDENYFYSVEDSKIYRHKHGGDYLTFSGIKYPFSLEFINKSFVTNTTEALQYYCTFDKEGEILSHHSYTNLWIYTSKQSTGKLNLQVINQHENPYDNIDLSPDTKSVIITDENHKISNLWDYATSSKVFTSNCEDLDTSEDGYSDRVPINIDYNKSPYESGVLKDKYAHIRLWYYPEDTKIRGTHHLIDINEQQSFR